MFRTLSAFLFAVALSLCCVAAPTFAAPPVAQAAPVAPAGQAQYFPLTQQSLPQMLQQAGYQVTPYTDALGTYWVAADLQTGKKVNVEPQKVQGAAIQGIFVAYNVQTGAISPQQLQAINAQIAPHYLTYNQQTNQLWVMSRYDYNDSNPSELKAWVDTAIAKANQTSQLLGGNGQFVPAPAPVPAVNPNPAPVPTPVFNPTPAPSPFPVPSVVNPVPPATVFQPAGNNLIGTTWKGAENLQGFGTILFQLQPAGKALMVDAKNTVPGTWTQNGNQITIQLGKYATYQGVVNGNLFTGQGFSGTSTWNFSVNKTN